MIKTRNELKETFVDGSYPDQQDYHDALDSYVHKDDLIPATAIDGGLKVHQVWLAGSQFAEAELTPTGLLEQASQQPASQEGGEGENSDEQSEDESSTSPIQATFQSYCPDVERRIVYVAADGRMLPPHNLPQGDLSFADLDIAGYTVTRAPEQAGDGIYTYALTLYEYTEPTDTLVVCLAFLAPGINMLSSSLQQP